MTFTGNGLCLKCFPINFLVLCVWAAVSKDTVIRLTLGKPRDKTILNDNNYSNYDKFPNKLITVIDKYAHP